MTARIRQLAARDPVVLVVDDQPSTRELVGALLRQAGYVVREATGGVDALRQATADPPDLVLLDMLMPGVDGFAVTTALHEHPATADLPVIFLTAAAERQYLVRAFECGAVDFVGKPFVAEELLARVRTHLELKFARDHLKRIAREREDLASLVAHDLKNPLSTIRFSAQLLERQPEDGPRTVRLAGTIKTAVDNALGFIADYLERRAGEASPEQQQLGRVALDAAVLDAAARFEPALAAKSLTLAVDELTPVEVRGDPAAVAHVIDSLLSNAIKFSVAGSPIEIACGLGNPGTGRCLVLDRGEGIGEEDQRKLFRRFVRLKPQATAGEAGEGLGLALAKRDIAQMGGELWYEGRPGGGSVFAFELPLAG
jgi:two-component system, sensor histidine kinase and response regulator